MKLSSFKVEQIFKFLLWPKIKSRTMYLIWMPWIASLIFKYSSRVAWERYLSMSHDIWFLFFINEAPNCKCHDTKNCQTKNKITENVNAMGVTLHATIRETKNSFISHTKESEYVYKKIGNMVVGVWIHISTMMSFFLSKINRNKGKLMHFFKNVFFLIWNLKCKK